MPLNYSVHTIQPYGKAKRSVESATTGTTTVNALANEDLEFHLPACGFLDLRSISLEFTYRPVGSGTYTTGREMVPAHSECLFSKVEVSWGDKLVDVVSYAQFVTHTNATYRWSASELSRRQYRHGYTNGRPAMQSRENIILVPYMAKKFPGFLDSDCIIDCNISPLKIKLTLADPSVTVSGLPSATWGLDDVSLRCAFYEKSVPPEHRHRLKRTVEFETYDTTLGGATSCSCTYQTSFPTHKRPMYLAFKPCANDLFSRKSDMSTEIATSQQFKSMPELFSSLNFRINGTPLYKSSDTTYTEWIKTASDMFEGTGAWNTGSTTNPPYPNSLATMYQRGAVWFIPLTNMDASEPVTITFLGQAAAATNTFCPMFTLCSRATVSIDSDTGRVTVDF
jgi:hypothetical protein